MITSKVNNNIKYSVLIPVYIKDNDEWIKISLDSMINQTYKADEIIVLCDGPIKQSTYEILNIYKTKYPNLIFVIKFKKNRGLGLTLADGVKLASNDYIFRMDADDYSVPNRCEEQLRFIIDHPEYDLISCNTKEFINSTNNIIAVSNRPEKNEEILKYAKRRNPMVHPAFLFKKNSVLDSGNYKDLRRNQDYDLIIRMLLNNKKMYNIQKYLVYMRVNDDFYKRRGGISQAKEIIKLKWSFYKYGYYTISDFLVSGLGHAFVCVLPNQVREFIYKRFLRS